MHMQDKPALIDQQRTLTYRDLYGAMTWAEAFLLAHGLKSGDRIGLCFGNDMGHLIVVLAAGRIGVTTLSLDARCSADEVRLYTRIASLDRIVGDRDLDGLSELPNVRFDQDWLDGSNIEPDFGAARAQGGDLLFVISLSSGTTGQPSPALTTHRQYSLMLGGGMLDFGRIIGRRYLCMTSFAFSASRNLCLVALMGGSTVYLHPPLFWPGELVEEMRRLRIDSAFMVPTVIRWLLTIEPPSDGLLLPDFHSLIVGGAMFSAREKQQAVALITPNIVEFYGTSVVGNLTALWPHEMANKAASVGRPGLLVDVEIVDDAGERLPAGQVGRIRCAAPRWPVNPGIELATPADQPQPPHGSAWYYPGEVGSFDESGYLFLKSRVSDLIIRAGANIYPGEIEDVLMSHDAVIEAAVVGRPDPVMGECVVAFVTTREAVGAEMLRQHCRDRLLPYKVPEELLLVDSLPKTAAGKVRKHVLAQRWRSQPKN